MIKKIFLWVSILWVFCLWFINFSLWYFSPTIKINLPWNFVNWNIYNNITSNLDFENENWYYISINDWWNKYNIFWNWWELYNYWYYSYFNNYTQWRFKRFCSADWTWYCTSNYTTWTALEFYNLENVNFTEMTISLQAETDDPWFCFYNQVNNKNYCTQVYDQSANIILSWSLNIPNNTTDFSQRTDNSNFLISTWSFNYSWNEQLLSENVDTIINFYESRYWFSENICYVWTDDLVTEFWSWWFSFEMWSWWTVFSMYSRFYSWWDLTDVWTFIDVWQLNYVQWFKNRTDPDSLFYLVTWDWPWTNVKVQYDNLDFPFSWKPAALYFMTNNIYDSSPEFQMWDEIVTYCYAKLNRDNLQNWTVDFDSFYNILPDYIKWNINDYTNYTITTNNWYLVPDTWWGETNMWNYIVSTWSGIPEDLQPSNLFVWFYNRITNLVQNFNPFSNPLLPEWIIYPLIFLVLFRILKH